MHVILFNNYAGHGYGVYFNDEQATLGPVFMDWCDAREIAFEQVTSDYSIFYVGVKGLTDIQLVEFNLRWCG